MVKSLYIIGGLFLVFLFMIITGSKTIEGRAERPAGMKPGPYTRFGRVRSAAYGNVMFAQFQSPFDLTARKDKDAVSPSAAAAADGVKPFPFRPNRASKFLYGRNMIYNAK